MMDAISHRGPNDEGNWVDGSSGVALGFRRLAILDLSANGHQPMSSINNRYVIVYNGEVYNFQELRETLVSKGYSFKGGSDTEVMLASFCEWGIFEAIKKFNGMFAFALWDKKDELLYLVRDRIGVKPLYYGWQGDFFYFGSELKALRRHSHFTAVISQEALAQYFQFGYVPTPLSIYENIYKLEPASILIVDPRKPGNLPRAESYWHLPTNSNGHFKGDEKETLSELETLLAESVKLRMIADVPLGAFLSGGVDSSTVVALMQSQSPRPIKTFTIGFHEDEYNEARHAKRVAEHLGTDHTELYLSWDEATKVVPKIPYIYDEPFADSSQIPTYLVSELARRDVTVSLSGDGGDELFLGYNRYLWAKKIWKSVAWLPRNIQSMLARTALNVPVSKWDGFKEQFSFIIPPQARYPQFGDKVHKLARVLEAGNPHDLYNQLVSFWPPDIVLANKNTHLRSIDTREPEEKSFLEWMGIRDIQTYLLDDILVKLDRASMAVSLEARVPLLDDHRVVEFAMRLPVSMKIRTGKSKWALRQILYKYIPQKLIERPKMGFGVPIDSWLRGPMQEWAESLLALTRIRSQGLLNPDLIQRKWQEHLSGARNWQYHLWNVLMFQSWYEVSESA